MNRRSFIKLLGIAPASTLLEHGVLGRDLLPASEKQAQRPNILFIMTDQQSYNMMSCMGNTWLKTPFMDSLAAKGYRFDKAYCSNPVCMPSRFSLATGQYASSANFRENITVFDKQQPKIEQIANESALGRLFLRSGYETHYSGKTHLVGTGGVSLYGFSLHGYDPYDGPAIYAEKFLSERGKDKQEKPFFLFLSFMNPHDICYKAGADKRFPDKIPEDKVRQTKRLLALQKSMDPAEYKRQIPPPPANIAPIAGEQPGMVEMSVEGRNWDASQWDLYNWMYHRFVEIVDAQIGRALTALKKAGLEENTIIVFTSDHGEMNRAHGLISKNVMFEECQRVPFIISGPGIKSGVVDSSTLVCNGLDFLPTICDLAGVKRPSNLPGVSLKPYLTGVGEKTKTQYIITESYNAFQIHDGRFKYTVFELPGNPETLTNIETNPGETVNYAAEPACTEIKNNLKKRLMANLEQRGLLPLRELGLVGSVHGN